MILTGRMTDIIQHLVRDSIQPGDVLVDGTMGNGHDTLFLAKELGGTGHVHSFDIQELALENTHKLLEDEKLADGVSLHLKSHDEISDVVKEPIKGAIFNLGYLPKGDKNIITKGNTTIKALEQCLSLLVKKGFIAITCYYGHPGGEEEKNQVVDYLCQLDDKKFTTVKVDFVNRHHHPPIIFIVEKR